MEEPGGLQSMGLLESDTTERLPFHFSLSCLGEGNGNPLQCSCLENPRDREPGGLTSMGSHRVGHDWSDLAAAAAVVVTVIRAGGVPDVHDKLLQLHLTLCDPRGCSLPGSSVHGILQVRILEWIVVPSSRGSFWLRNRTLSLLHCRPGKPKSL